MLFRFIGTIFGFFLPFIFGTLIMYLCYDWDLSLGRQIIAWLIGAAVTFFAAQLVHFPSRYALLGPCVMYAGGLFFLVPYTLCMLTAAVLFLTGGTATIGGYRRATTPGRLP